MNKLRSTLKRLFSYRNFSYFLPGIKRWIVALVLGIICIVFGVALVLEYRPLTVISSLIWNLVREVAKLVPPHISGPIVLIVGAGLIGGAIWYSFKTILEATMDDPTYGMENTSIFKSLERAHRRGQGPKIVAIGGGTGLSTLLRGIKSYSRNITAIVTVGDDGGSSGKLRQELQVVPPGDIRNCIVALSDEEETLTSLFQYRFQEGTLKGHSLGNLFLAALCDVFGDMSQATQVASRILRCGGKVLPSSLEAVHLCAELEDGRIIDGESQIPKAQGQIKRVFTNNAQLSALPECLQSIKEADLIILGPGSLYTSIIPNLLFPEIVQAITEASAKVLYVCNLVTDRETEGYTAEHFIEAVHIHTQQPIVDAVLLNAKEGWNLSRGYIPYNVQALQEKGLEVIVRSKLHDQQGRHNSLRLARSIMQWLSVRQRNQSAVSPSSVAKCA